MKASLIVSGVLNMFGALLFLPASASLRSANGFPDGSHPLYLSIISSWIFLFGLCYLWLGIKGRSERLFLVTGAAGKAAFVLLAFLFAALGDIPVTTALSTLPDLVFAALFTFYLFTSTD
jgi:fatty acid desaturase